MILLFSDIDGVLHPEDRRDGILSCLPRFESVLRDFAEVEIVISSTWRLQAPLGEIQRLFSPDIARRIIGVTPDCQGFEPESGGVGLRQKEIECWLRWNNRESEIFLAIDDMPGLFSEGCTWLVRVDPITGFEANAEAHLRERLNAAAIKIESTWGK